MWKPRDKYYWIRELNASMKGKTGEVIIEEIFKKRKISPRDSSEHDLMVDGKKWEIKLSCLNESGLLNWRHIRTKYDYDTLALIGVYPNAIRVWILPKRSVGSLLKNRHLKLYKGKTDKDKYPDCFLPVNAAVVPRWLRKYEVSIETGKHLNNRIHV
jgi:hypothetical protein